MSVRIEPPITRGVEPPTDGRLSPRLVILDLDGVIYRGASAIAGAGAAVAELRRRRIQLRFATNDSTSTRSSVAARLRRMGIACSRLEVVTAASAAARILRRRLPAASAVLLVGARPAGLELEAAGYAVTPARAARQLPGMYRFAAVAVGASRSFDYRQLALAATAIRSGAAFIALGYDGAYPSADGFLPAAGSIVAAVAKASGRRPTVIGKPAPGMFQLILREAAVDPADALVIGDNPHADVRAAKRAGIPSALVLTGMASRADIDRLPATLWPTVIASDVAQVVSWLAASPLDRGTQACQPVRLRDRLERRMYDGER